MPSDELPGGARWKGKGVDRSTIGDGGGVGTSAEGSAPAARSIEV